MYLFDLVQLPILNYVKDTSVEAWFIIEVLTIISLSF